MTATGLDTKLIKILQQMKGKESEIKEEEEKFIKKQNENKKKKIVAMYTTNQ